MTGPSLAGRESLDSANVITIARIIGNDLYPRHADGQFTKNLEYILEHEPDFPNCRKVFVINRFFDTAREQLAVDMIRKYGHMALVVPFVDQDYARIEFDAKYSDGPVYPPDGHIAPPFAGKEMIMRLWACADKIRYAMNINGARNTALEDGRKNGKWTVLLDGSCFVSEQAFKQLERDLFRRPVTPYVLIPMMRLQSNDQALTVTPVANRNEEPQIAFHRDSTESFDERFPYGLRDKTSLFSRLRVPGPWSEWDRWEGLPREDGTCADRHHYKFSSTCVFRLSSGVKDGQLEARGSRRERYQSRNKAIFHTLAMLDRRVGLHTD